jgi:hypothetical protein
MPQEPGIGEKEEMVCGQFLRGQKMPSPAAPKADRAIRLACENESSPGARRAAVVAEIADPA